MARSRVRRTVSKRSSKKYSSKRKLRGGYGNKVLVDALCDQANDQTLDKAPELKGIVKGICNKTTNNSENNASNNNVLNSGNNTTGNSLLDAAGGFFNASGATGMASKALKGFGNVATLPMRIAFGALGKITGFNPMNNSNNDSSNNDSSNNDSEPLAGGNKDVSKLIEQLNTVDKKYLGPEIVEQLKNFGQSGGRIRKRKTKLRKRKNNKKSLKKKNRK